MNKTVHAPVLAEETVRVLSPQKGERYLDLTAGYGGHASLILKATENYTGAILVDRDHEATEYLAKFFKPQTPVILQKTFAEAAKDLISGKEKFDIILADLGLSSPHLDIASRGFSFMHEGPLDMRMDQSSSLTAEAIVNTYAKADLNRILKDYGEEWQSERIVGMIVAERPFKTTTELAKKIESLMGWRAKGHHPATKTFQALRIAVNDELELLSDALPNALGLLSPGGRMGVITFHSLEDRIVKKAFQDVSGNGYDSEFTLLTKKPVLPTHHEIVYNPRARSAKLRALVKK